MHRQNNFKDYSDPYSGSFIVKAKQTVFKWWCIVYQPVYKLFTHQDYPGFTQIYAAPDKKDDMAVEMANQILDDVSTNTTVEEANISTEEASNTATEEANTVNGWDDSVDTSGMAQDDVDLAKEIMERLAREAAADEAKKQEEIARARAEADEQARLAQIMQSNQVDISQFIEEGRANAAEAENKGE